MMSSLCLKEICNLQNGFAFKSKDYVESSNTINFRMSQIRPGGRIDLKHNPKFLPNEFVEKYKDYLLKDGDIVIAMTDMASDTKILGVPTIVKSNKEKLLLNQRVGKLYNIDLRVVSIPYLRYILTAPQIYAQYKKLGKGGVQINLGKDDILGIHIPVFSLLEQKAIVAKIEQLFSELDKGIESLKTAQAKLKIYRQAVLKKAFEGEFTREWRERQTNLPTTEELLKVIKQECKAYHEQQFDEWKIAVKKWEKNGSVGKKPTAPTESKRPFTLTNDVKALLSAIPSNWAWIQSGDIFTFVTSGSRGWAQYYSDKGAYFIRITNMNFHTLKLDLSKTKIQYVELPENIEGKRTKIENGDFLFSITGDLGMFAIAPELKEAYVNQHVSLARPLPKINKKFYGYWIVSESGGKFFLNYKKKGATKAGLGLDEIREFPVPLCSTLEQNQIVQEIESRLSVCDKIEQTISDALIKAEALRQSILKKAFEGKLLHVKELEAIKSHPEYESAAKLLKRIKLERAK